MGLDVIGDIHPDKLEAWLRTLGYTVMAGSWRHPERQAIFVGDSVDRGPAQLRAVDIVRRMVDAGAARAVMGSHDLNAIAWHTPDPRQPWEFLRPHQSLESGDKNRAQARSVRQADGAMQAMETTPKRMPDRPTLRAVDALADLRCTQGSEHECAPQTTAV